MLQNVKRKLFFILTVCTIFYVHGSTVEMLHGERFSGPVVTVVATVGQKQCVKECLARPNLCKGINYQRKHLLCEVVSSTEKSESSQDYAKASIEQVRTYDNLISLKKSFNVILNVEK